MPELFNQYLKSLKEATAELDLNRVNEIVVLLQEAQKEKRQVFLFGNGGSAATASHFAVDLAKQAAVPGKPPLRAISLTDNVAMLTAIANDISYTDIFVEQMAVLWNEGDLAIGISASGNSPNVLKAIEYAKSHGGQTIGFCGFGGGKLAQIADLNIIFSSRNYGVVEDMHLTLTHLISQALRLQPEGSV
ncbi:MAG: SIS domain-containing protein [Chloroflexi bacterium]|nr:SIS domain-containing protein [Chloroflexota bacterium]